MELTEEEAFELQQCMCVLTEDEYSPDSIGYIQCGWEFSVNIIYRCMVSGIWGIWNGGWLESRGIVRNDYYGFCKRLAGIDPKDAFRPELPKQERWIASDYWVIPHISATPLNDALLDKHSPQAGDYRYLYENLCIPLIEEIEALFEQHGVPWRAGGLFEIGKKEHFDEYIDPTIIDLGRDFYKVRERKMPASPDPNIAAQDYIRYLFGGQMPSDREPIPIKNHPDCWLARSADGSTVVYRPANTADGSADNNIAIVEIYNPAIRLINGARSVKLKFPQQQDGLWGLLKKKILGAEVD